MVSAGRTAVRPYTVTASRERGARSAPLGGIHRERKTTHALAGMPELGYVKGQTAQRFGTAPDFPRKPMQFQAN
jgi:hypothetical protein